MQKIDRSLILLALLTFSACTTQTSVPNRSFASTPYLFETSELPIIETNADMDLALRNLTIEIQKKLRRNDKKINSEASTVVVEKLKRYIAFLGLTAKDFRKAAVLSDTSPVVDQVVPTTVPTTEEPTGEEGEEKVPSNLNAIQRLFAASIQFLYCPDLRDWVCLEKAPMMKPSAAYRLPLEGDLGAPVAAGEKLDMEVFFTQGWDGSPKAGVVDELAKRISTEGTKSLSVAMYGIDDIRGSMRPVYDAIAKAGRDPSIDLRAVVDVAGFQKKGPWIFSYTAPNDNEDRWMFSTGSSGTGFKTLFQYDGTPNFIQLLNTSAIDNETARVRIEWPASSIMHNKFVVLENSEGDKSVWTGTANISKNCMGEERNSNMSVYIRNNQIAQAFKDEFELMYNFDPKLNVKTKLVVTQNGKPLQVGRFHRNKYPVSHRLFTFEDGTLARLYFAPTGDAEHRAILPMLLSAQPGDEIRISMFGGTGYEIVRAMQYAVAKGANIRIVFDRKLGAGQTSWIRDTVLNVFMNNPYVEQVIRPEGIEPGTITVRTSQWPGKNHYKVGSLARRQADGSMVAEQIIIGSQNWSSGGNESNDENLLAIMNVEKGVEAAEKFNHEFDTRLWNASRQAFPRK